MNAPKFSTILLCSLQLTALLGLLAVARYADAEGQALFEKRCVACHKLPDPGQPPAAGWEQQLELMAPLARLKKDQKQDVLDYLLSHTRDAAMRASMDEDRILFENKCSRCHTLDRIFLIPLEGENLGHVINRMQSRSGTDWLSDQEVERVLAYLSNAPRTLPNAAVGDDATPEQIFALRCSACHTLERIFQKLDDGSDIDDFWSHTISRMQGKAPQWMSEVDAEEILDYLQFVKMARQKADSPEDIDQ